MKIKLTYMRVMIVAFVIGLIASAFGPSLSSARIDKRTNQLIDNLYKIRANIELFKACHDGQLPPVDSFEKFQAAFDTKDKCCTWRMKTIPVNPFNGLNTIRFDNDPAGINKAGYRLDTVTGDLQADNDSAYSAL